MIVVLVFTLDALPHWTFEGYMKNPFQGIEVLSVHATQEGADKQIENAARLYPEWKFHTEEWNFPVGDPPIGGHKRNG